MRIMGTCKQEYDMGLSTHGPSLYPHVITSLVGKMMVNHEILGVQILKS